MPSLPFSEVFLVLPQLGESKLVVGALFLRSTWRSRCRSNNPHTRRGALYRTPSRASPYCSGQLAPPRLRDSFKEPLNAEPLSLRRQRFASNSSLGSLRHYCSANHFTVRKRPSLARNLRLPAQTL